MSLTLGLVPLQRRSALVCMSRGRRGVGASIITLVGFLVLGVVASYSASAETFPSRPMRIIVPFSPGGGGDLPVRVLAKELERILEQSIIIENHPGAGGNVGIAYAARSKPDGYTLMVMTPGTSLISPLLGQSRISYKEIAPIGMIMRTPLTLSVLSSSRFASLHDVITYAQVNPKRLTYSSGGPGSISQIAGLLLQQSARMQATEVPYNGDATALPDFLAGRVDVSLSSLPALLPFVQNGRVRTLVIMGDSPAARLPGVPTAAQAGLPQLIAGAWLGLGAPANTPADRVQILNSALDQAIATPAVTESFQRENYTPGHETVASFARFLEAEHEKWSTVLAHLAPRKN